MPALPVRLPAPAGLARPPLPYAAVLTCHGPAAGGAGVYLCTTRPRGPQGIRTVTVDVTPAGVWSTRQTTVRVTRRGRAVTAAQVLWGWGIRLPR